MESDPTLQPNVEETVEKVIVRAFEDSWYQSRKEQVNKLTTFAICQHDF